MHINISRGNLYFFVGFKFSSILLSGNLSAVDTRFAENPCGKDRVGGKLGAYTTEYVTFESFGQLMTDRSLIQPDNLLFFSRRKTRFLLPRRRSKGHRCSRDQLQSFFSFPLPLHSPPSHSLSFSLTRNPPVALGRCRLRNRYRSASVRSIGRARRRKNSARTRFIRRDDALRREAGK